MVDTSTLSPPTISLCFMILRIKISVVSNPHVGSRTAMRGESREVFAISAFYELDLNCCGPRTGFQTDSCRFK